MPIISTYCKKGGVGKTTYLGYLAHYVASQGKKVLIISIVCVLIALVLCICLLKKNEEPKKEKQEETGEKELEKKVKPIENSIKEAGKNYNFSSFKTRNERIKESNKSFYC